MWVSLMTQRGDGVAAGSESLGMRPRWECRASPQVYTLCSGRQPNRPVNEVVDARMDVGLKPLQEYDPVGRPEDKKISKEANSKIV